MCLLLNFTVNLNSSKKIKAMTIKMSREKTELYAKQKTPAQLKRREERENISK